MPEPGATRKSKRTPIPNPQYFQDISKFKKQSNAHAKAKKKGRPNEEDFSNDEDCRHEVYSDPHAPTFQSKSAFLHCVMPDGSDKQVQFIVHAREEKSKKQTFKCLPKNNVTTEPTNKQAPSNLLNIFREAIEKEGIVNDEKEPRTKYAAPTIKRPKKSSEKLIQKLTVEDGCIQIQHSTLGSSTSPSNTVQFLTDWKPVQKMEVEPSQYEQELRKKISELRLLKDIPIFST